jgi:hypothetical protein
MLYLNNVKAKYEVLAVKRSYTHGHVTHFKIKLNLDDFSPAELRLNFMSPHERVVTVKEAAEIASWGKFLIRKKEQLTEIDISEEASWKHLPLTFS